MKSSNPLLLALGLSDPRAAFLTWIASRQGDLVTATECYEAFGGSGARAVVESLIDAGLVSDVSKLHRDRRRIYRVHRHAHWATIKKVLTIAMKR